MYGVRLAWTDLPQEVRAWVAAELGSPVVAATSQPAGFSPGSADRVVTADGRRAFVKAVSADQNPDTPALHRREIDVLGTLVSLAVPGAAGGGLGIPQLLASYDDGHWVALLIEDVDGSHPLPWSHDLLAAVLHALAVIATVPAPASWPALEQELVSEMGSWSRLRENPPAGLDPWALAHLEELEALSLRTLPQMAGGAVAHTDLRADNLLVDKEGLVWVLDWPWASRGAPWCDAVMLLVNVRLDGDLDLRPHLHIIDDLGGSLEEVLGLVAGLSGFFEEASRRPAAPGLPTLRDFQRRQALAALSLVRELWPDPMPTA